MAIKKNIAISSNNLLILFIALSFIQFNVLPGGRYFLTFIFIFLSMIVIFYKSKIFLIDTFYFFLFLLVGALLTVQSETDVEYLISFSKVFFMYGAFITASKVNLSNEKDRSNLFLAVNLAALFVLSIDFYSRYSSIGFDLSRIYTNFYLVKFNSLIFTDTNGVGIYIAIIIGINFLLYKSVGLKRWIVFQSLLYFFVLTTMSRSAIISCFLGFICFLIVININKINVYIKFLFFIIFPMLLILIVILTMGLILDKVGEDGSGGTKIKTFLVLYDNFGLAIWHDLIGYGLKSGSLHYSFEPNVRYAHAAIPLLLGMIGLIGTFIYCAIVSFPIFKNLLYIPSFLMFFLIGLSYLEVLYESLFVLVGLAYNYTVNVFSVEQRDELYDQG